MTDTDTAVARLEAVLDRLERLGLVPPVPGQTAATDPDGYPAAVVSGELIEAAWGNAVVDKLRNHYEQLANSFVQSGTAVLGASAGNLYQVFFPEPFADNPAVTVINGDIGATVPVVISQYSLAAHTVVFAIHDMTGAPLGGTFRLTWIAHGPKVFP